MSDKIRWEVWREEDGEGSARVVDACLSGANNAAEAWAEEEDERTGGALSKADDTETVVCVRQVGGTEVKRFGVWASVDVTYYAGEAIGTDPCCPPSWRS